MGAFYINGPLYKYVIKFMNELLELDREAVTNLIERRVDCNEVLSKHPTVQVGIPPNKCVGVGMLGILNGLCGTRDSDKFGFVTANYKNGKIESFSVTRRKGDMDISDEFYEFEIKEVTKLR